MTSYARGPLRRDQPPASITRRYAGTRAPRRGPPAPCSLKKRHTAHGGARAAKGIHEPGVRNRRPRLHRPPRPRGPARPDPPGLRPRGRRPRPGGRATALAPVSPGRPGRQVAPPVRRFARVAGPRPEDPPGAPARPARHRPLHSRNGSDGREVPVPGRLRGPPGPLPRRRDRRRRRADPAPPVRRRTLGDPRPELRRLPHPHLSVAGPRGAARLLRRRWTAGSRGHRRRRVRPHLPPGARSRPRLLRPLPRRRRPSARDRGPPLGHRRTAARRGPAHPRRLRALGLALGMGDGHERIHWLLDEALDAEGS